MLGNKNQSSIHSYLQPYHQQQQSSSNQQQSQLNQYLQQRENNRGSLQKALSPVRNSIQKPVAVLKQNQKVSSQNNFKEESSISSKIRGQSSLLKNNNAVFGGGVVDNSKQKPDNTQSPGIKNNNIQRNSLLSSQQIKQSTQNLTYLLTKGKESKSVEQKCLNNYQKDVQEKQNQKGIDDGRNNEIYQTPQSKINQSGMNGQQSVQQYQQQQINGNLSNTQYNISNTQLLSSQSSQNHVTSTPQNSGNNNICTINLCDKQDIQKNLNQTNQINTANILMNGTILVNNQKSPVNSAYNNNRLVLQPNGSPHSSTSTLKQNQAQNVNNQKNSYFGQIRNSSQLSHSNISSKSNGHQQSSADNKLLQQKTKHIDLALSNTGLKKQSSQSSQQSTASNSHLNQNTRYDQSPMTLNNNSLINSKNSQSGIGNNLQQYHSNGIYNGKDINKKQSQQQSVNLNRQNIQSSTSNINQRPVLEGQPTTISLSSQQVERRVIDQTGSVNEQQSSVLQFQSEQKSYPSHQITSNSISTGIEGSTVESYLSPVKSPLPLQTIDLRSPEHFNQSPNIYQLNTTDMKNPKEDPFQFQSFNSTSSYINQMVPIDKKFNESEIQSIPQQILQPQKINHEIEGIMQNHTDQSTLKENIFNPTNSYSQNVEKSNFIYPNNTNQFNYLNQTPQQNQLQTYQMEKQPSQKSNEINQQYIQQIDYLQSKNGQQNNIYNTQEIYPISQALKEFQLQVEQFPSQVNENQQYDKNNTPQMNQEKNTALIQNIQPQNFDYNEFLKKQQQFQYNQVSPPVQNDYIPQNPLLQTLNNFEGVMSEEEKIKRQKLNNFQSRLFKIKGDFENLQKMLQDKNDSSIQEYHKNVEYIENIQKTMIGAMNEISSKQKERLMNNFNENLSKCKDSKFEIQQILNYLNCTENDLMSNLDSIIKDMDFESLDDIIQQYNQIITQYDEARTKKFLSINFNVYQMKHQNDPSQLNICCSKIQEGIQHLLTTINYSYNIQRNQINTNIQQNGVSQNSFLSQQPKSIYVSFENRDIFQSAAQSTPEQNHPETQPQSPSFQSTFSLHAQQQNAQSSSQTAQQFLTFKDIIMNEEQNQKFLQQAQQSIQLTDSQQSFQAYPFKSEADQAQVKHLYPINIEVTQKSSFGGDQVDEFPDSPVTQQQKNQSSNYYSHLNNKINEKEGQFNTDIKSQILGSFKEYNNPIQTDQKQVQKSSVQINLNNNDLNYTKTQTSGQNMPLSTQLDNFPSIDDKKQNIPNSQLYQDTNGKQKRKNMSVEQNHFDKNKKYNEVGISLINPSNIYDNQKQDNFKVSHQKIVSQDEYGMNGNIANHSNKLLIRSEDNLFGKLKNQGKNYYEIVSPASNSSQNYHGGYSQNQSDDFQFNQSTATTFSNTNNSQHQHNLSIKSKQKYNDLLQKIQVNQSQTEKLCTDVLSSGANFKLSQIEENNTQSSQSGNHKPAQLSLSKK